MKKTFVSNLILLMSVNLLVKPFWILGIDRGVQNKVGYEAYGIYADLFAFSMLFITLLDLGLNTYMSSNVAKDPAKLQSEFVALTGFKLISSLLYLAITLGLGSLNNYNQDRLHLLLLLGLNQILGYFYTYFRSIVGGLQMFKTDALLSIVDRSLMILFCGLMLWTGLFDMSIPRFIYAQTIAYSIAASIALWFIFPFLKNLQREINFHILKKVILQMMPYALLSLLMTFYTRLDVVLIRNLSLDGDVQNGIYASAYRLLEAANMMVALVAMLLLPIFSKMIAQKEPLSPLVQFSTGLMFLPAFAVGLITFIWQQPIIRLLNYQSTDYSGHVFGLVMLCFVPLALMYVYGTLLTANGSMKILNILAGIGLFLNICLNLWLIPIYQAWGAAVAAIVTQGFVGVSNFVYGKKLLSIRFEPNFSRSILISMMMIVGLGLTLYFFEMNWIFGSTLIILSTLSLMFYFKMIDVKQAFALLKSRNE